MAIHMSVRLAWHSDGWNGHICKNPCQNVYCVGQYSYPGNLISELRNLEFETKYKGEPCSKFPCQVACGLSVNAFGGDTIQVRVNPPTWWNGGADPADITLPPYTVCTWCYESMYSDDVLMGENSSQKYDYNQRSDNAEKYFSQFEENKSLVFYYSGYSNPFSEDEENNYVVVGVSRIKKIDDFYYYKNVEEDLSKKYAGGIVWQKPITSNYPDEGFCIPYQKYMDREDILDRLLIKPQHRFPFKYGSREVSNDDALDIISQLLNTVDVLIEIGDTTENWVQRKEWLNNVLVELWKSRGPYPGFISVLQCLKLNNLISPYIALTDKNDMLLFRQEVKNLLDGVCDNIRNITFAAAELKIIRREYKLLEDNVRTLLWDILPRFDISANQIQSIISDDRENVSIQSTVDEMIENPYIIFEQYKGYDSDDVIPFYKIDNGVLVSPEYGIEDLLDKGCTERLRAMCVDELNRIPAHSFGNADTILKSVNHRIDFMPEWKRHKYKNRNFEIEKDILEGALHIEQDDKGDLYLYLKWVYEDERTVENVLRKLVDRPDIELKMLISEEKFKQNLRNPHSELNTKAKEQYEQILDKQAEICMQIFAKPLCVLSGAAGTGKTTVIRAIVENIERVHGKGAGFLLMAPTGKAAERIKTQTGKNSKTLHSFLASHGWINDNFTFKRFGGKSSDDINTIIIDECSMIDLNLFATLMKALNWNNIQRLILVGDPNQLPPIGRGKVFSDVIEWLSAHYHDNVGVLTENIRQLVNTVEGNGCGILNLANVFIQENQASDDYNTISKLKSDTEEIFGQILENGNGTVDKDLSVYFWKDQRELENVLTDVLVKDMEDYTGLNVSEETSLHALWDKAIKNQNGEQNPEAIQIISPYRGEFYGTEALNVLMQKTFNGYWNSKYTLDGVTYFDKVIQIRNRPQSDMIFAYNFDTKKIEKQEIYNGEIGIVGMHPFERKNKRFKYINRIERIQVKFSNESRKNLSYCYGKKFWKNERGWWLPEQKVEDNLELAYAISVHKSQGSEFDYVYIVIPKRDSHLLSMELLYTAITRAQKRVTIFLQEDIGTLTTLSHMEKSAVKKINSSIFKFAPLPEDLLYIQNWYESEKKLATLSEYFVRSKSEVIIANILTQKGVLFKYELPLYAKDGSMYLPDFTVKFQGETYYWEHVGRLDLPQYKAHWEKKLKWYEKHFPGRLIITYESPNLSTDAMEIIEKYT